MSIPERGNSNCKGPEADESGLFREQQRGKSNRSRSDLVESVGHLKDCGFYFE